MRSRAVFCASVLLAAAAPSRADDLTIVSKVTVEGKPPRTAVSYLSRDHIRTARGERGEAIVDLKTGQMTILDVVKKTYSVITREDMDQMAARLKEQMNSPEMKKAEEQMKNLSREDRKKADDAMGALFAFDVQRTGTTRKIAGYTCENWKIAMGELTRTEACLTSELQYPVQAWDAYKNFDNGMMSLMTMFGPMAKRAEQMREKFKQMRGYPLATTSTVDVMGHQTTSASEVTEIRRGPIPDSAWAIPADYTRIENPMTKTFERRRK